MDNHPEENILSEYGTNGFTTHVGFALALKFIFFACFLGVMTQNLYMKTGNEDGFNILGIGITFIVFALFGILWGKKILRIIDTPYFAVSGILLIALATGLGTFIGQNMAPEAFQYRYGQIGSSILKFLQLNDVFHSWWYIILFLLLTISLIKISFRRKLILSNLGFHLAHLGPVIVLFGFWWDYYAGYRGLIQLVSGKSTNVVSVYYNNTNKVKDTINLDFNVKLDYFKSEKFDPDHRVQIWENSAAANEEIESRIIASLPPEVDKERKIYGTDIKFQVKEFYPNFYLEYSYPDKTDTIAAINPGILFELINPHGSNVMQLRAGSQGQNGFEDPILRVVFEFFWTLPEKVRNDLDNFDSSAAWAQKPRVIFHGSENMIYEIAEGVLTRKEIDYEDEHQVPGKDKSGYRIIFIYPDAAYLTSQPATRDLKQLNPVARLEISSDEWETTQEAFLYPQEKGAGGQYLIPETEYMIALESFKDKETKFWESGLSIVDNGENVLKQKKILVNEPLLHKGYRFYQSDYDPNNPNYSGIGVSYTPGLTLIYFGFYVLIAGVILLFYLRKKENLLIEEPTT